MATAHLLISAKLKQGWVGKTQLFPADAFIGSLVLMQKKPTLNMIFSVRYTKYERIH
jgi:hypothetical protein